MNTTSELLLTALKCAVTEKPLEWADTPDWSALLRMAKRHHVAALLQHVARWTAPPEIEIALNQEWQQAVFNEMQQSYTAQLVGCALKRAKVAHIFLRGTVLKCDYPAPELRVMSDIDILVKKEDFKSIRREMELLGGRLVQSDASHRSYFFPPNVTVEFHPSLIYVAAPLGTGINPGWQYAQKSGDGCAAQLTEEGFYLSLIAHLACHFAGGGTGIRSILDVWVYRHRHHPQPDVGILDRELKRVGLWRFNQQIEALAECWFGDGEMTRELDVLGAYILSSGVYGTTSRWAVNSICLSGGKVRSTLGRIFYPMSDMKCRFPWLERAPVLLPVAWCMRAWRAVTLHGTAVKSFTGNTMTATPEAICQAQTLLRQVGLTQWEDHENEAI